MPSTIALDHLIVLVPYAWVKEPPEWLTRHFTVTPGGTHSDGKTANILIVFKSGVYIEMIAFVDDRQDFMEEHWWGKKKYGWVDWALTYKDQKDFEGIMQRIGSSAKGSKYKPFNYEKPVGGGRKRPDGTQIEWEVTFPEAEVERGAIPVWCKDITPRELRVPIDDKATSHPCKAAGIDTISLIMYNHATEETLATYRSIFNDREHASSEDHYSASWQVRQPNGSRKTTIGLQTIEDDAEEMEQWGEGQAVLWEIVLYAEEGADISKSDDEMSLFYPGTAFDTSRFPWNRQKGGREFCLYLEPWSGWTEMKKRKRTSASPAPEISKARKQSE